MGRGRMVRGGMGRGGAGQHGTRRERDGMVWDHMQGMDAQNWQTPER